MPGTYDLQEVILSVPPRLEVVEKPRLHFPPAAVEHFLEDPLENVIAIDGLGYFGALRTQHFAWGYLFDGKIMDFGEERNHPCQANLFIHPVSMLGRLAGLGKWTGRATAWPLYRQKENGTGGF